MQLCLLHPVHEEPTCSACQQYTAVFTNCRFYVRHRFRTKTKKKVEGGRGGGDQMGGKYLISSKQRMKTQPGVGVRGSNCDPLVDNSFCLSANIRSGLAPRNKENTESFGGSEENNGVISERDIFWGFFFASLVMAPFLLFTNHMLFVNGASAKICWLHLPVDTWADTGSAVRINMMKEETKQNWAVR